MTSLSRRRMVLEAPLKLKYTAWVYLDRPEIKELLRKSLDLNAVPILIARRIPFATIHVLGPCGVLFHQMYNQLYPSVDDALAALARDKRLLGYHDIRVGNQPDARLKRFIEEYLGSLLPRRWRDSSSFEISLKAM